ncbi:MAG: LON peptidase substrate-binding domain-containing protein [Planctomycetota bacterium]
MSDWSPDQLPFDKQGFCGVARLFPLPDLVLFPNVVQTLHIFEERYRAMMEDALATDQLIGMALYEPGWETDYAGRPPLSPVACLGRVMTHHRFADGRFNLMLLGVQRVRIVEEVHPPQAFRRAKVELIAEQSPPDADAVAKRLTAELQSRLRSAPLAPDHLQEVLSRELPLSVLTDLLGFALPLSSEEKRSMLADANPVSRAELLLKAIGQGLLGDTPADPASKDKAKPGDPGEGVWSPPQFSVN